MSALLGHLAGGITTVCRAWALRRADGVVLGFTDHDADLAFEGVAFRAGTGLSARVLAQTTGLAVDNTEAEGVLSDAGVSEGDLLAGRWDGAEVTAWRVNWTDVEQRMVLFRGRIGEVVRAGGAFQAELRGLTEGLNRPQGRAITLTCAAVLGDADCGFDLSQPGYSADTAAEVVEEGRVFRLAGLAGFDDRWFEGGRLVVQAGAAAGLWGVVKGDRIGPAGRVVELWQGLAAEVAPGTPVRLEAGCDKRPETCRLKFGNFLNFRGFPHVPGEDWLTSYPARAGQTGGGSRFR